MKRSIIEKQNEIKKLQKQIESIQDRCPHPKESLEKRYSGNTGYDYEHYWVNFHCLDCDKRWTAHNTEQEYYRQACLVLE